MEFFDYIKMIAGADKTIKVSKVEDSNVPEPPKDITPKAEELETPPKNDESNGQDTLNSTAELLKRIQSLQNENDALKKFNKEIVTNTPAPEQPTIEECILDMCVPGYRKEKANG